jgi:CheY-like chemotaxis protein
MTDSSIRGIVARDNVCATPVVPGVLLKAMMHSLDRSVGSPTLRGGSALNPLRILLVEDEVLIALAAQDMLLEAGAAEVVIATRADEAAQQLAQPSSIDAAIIDLNLGNGFDTSVATLTYAHGIPFILASGYAGTLPLPAELQHVPFVTKPFTTDSLIVALQQVLAASRARTPG